MSRQRMSFAERRHQRFVLRALRKANGSRCHWCSKPVRKARANLPSPMPHDIATLDHLEPRSRGGLTDGSNCVVACYACNTERGSMPVEQWQAKLAARSSAEARAA
ncbi:HNH endonuclease [Methylobacterium fujisawaense]